MNLLFLVKIYCVVTSRNKALFAVLVSIHLIVVLYWFLPEKENTYINILSIIGFVLSIVGLIIAYIQILSVKQVAENTKTQIDKSVSLNSNLLMVSDLARQSVMIDEIQRYLKDSKIELCILRMKEPKAVLNSLAHQGRYKNLFVKKEFNQAFQTFSIDLDNFQSHHLNNKNQLDKNAILLNMEKLSTILQSIEVKIKDNQS